MGPVNLYTASLSTRSLSTLLLVLAAFLVTALCRNLYILVKYFLRVHSFALGLKPCLLRSRRVLPSPSARIISSVMWFPFFREPAPLFSRGGIAAFRLTPSLLVQFQPLVGPPFLRAMPKFSENLKIPLFSCSLQIIAQLFMFFPLPLPYF